MIIIRKSQKTDLQTKYPDGQWITIGGSHVFVHKDKKGKAKVIAGLDNYDGDVDNFVKEKKTEKKPKKQALAEKEPEAKKTIKVKTVKKENIKKFEPKDDDFEVENKKTKKESNLDSDGYEIKNKEYNFKNYTKDEMILYNIDKVDKIFMDNFGYKYSERNEGSNDKHLTNKQIAELRKNNPQYKFNPEHMDDRNARSDEENKEHKKMINDYEESKKLKKSFNKNLKTSDKINNLKTLLSKQEIQLFDSIYNKHNSGIKNENDFLDYVFTKVISQRKKVK